MCSRGLVLSGHFADRQDKLVLSTLFGDAMLPGTNVGGRVFFTNWKRESEAVIPQHETCSDGSFHAPLNNWYLELIFILPNPSIRLTK